MNVPLLLTFGVFVGAVPVLCATAELQRLPDKNIIARYKTAAWGVTSAGRVMAGRGRISGNDFKAGTERAQYYIELAGFVRVLDEIYSSYKSAGITLDAVIAQVARSDAQLGSIEGECGRRISETKDRFAKARLKGLRGRLREDRRTMAAQLLSLRKRRANLFRTMHTVRAEREQAVRSAAGINGEIVRQEKRPWTGARKRGAAEGYVRVAPGQTFLGIAAANGISFSKLMRYNPRVKKNPSRLLANTWLRVK